MKPQPKCQHGLPSVLCVLCNGYVEDLKPTISVHDLNVAVTNECTCGGGGPEDKHTCPACQVWHRLVTLRKKEQA